MKHWFITGVSRGLGLAIAKAALEQGDRVVGTVRGEAPELGYDEEQFRLLKVDMADEQGATAAVHAAFQAFGRIDVLVNNAGYGLLGAVETSSDQEMRNLFEVNVFSPVRIIRAALPYLRAQGSGHILNVTSIAGRAPGVGSALYAASKFALEGLSTALAQEVGPLGIKVTAVAPGQFRTDFLSEHSVRKNTTLDESYASTVGSALSALSQINHNQLGDPDLAALAIVDLARAAQPPMQLLLGSDALERARGKINSVLQEMAAWEAVTVGTDFKHS